jgi:hypothetical protein
MTGSQLIGALAGLLLRTAGGRYLVRRLVVWAGVSILVTVAFGHLVASLQLALATVASPPLAMLLTASVLLAGAGMLVLGLHLHRRLHVEARATRQIDTLQRASTDLVRAHPWALVGLAMALGALSGLGPAPSRPDGDQTARAAARSS